MRVMHRFADFRWRRTPRDQRRVDDAGADAVHPDTGKNEFESPRLRRMPATEAVFTIAPRFC
jgi:hypothetical protein